MTGRIIKTYPEEKMLINKRINIKFKQYPKNIKPLNKYSIIILVNHECIYKEVVNAKGSKILDRFKTPYQKLDLIEQRKLSKTLNTNAGAFGWAMLWGSKEFLEYELLNKAKITGTMHFFAVSGLHFGIFYVFLSFMFRPISQNIITCLIIKLLICTIYLKYINFPESGIRAILMISVYELSYIFFGRQKPITIFCISAIITLLCYPSTVYSISCQLSFTVVLFIIFIMNGYSILKKGNYPIMNGIKTYFLISLAAASGSCLLIYDYFNHFSYVSVFINLLLTPFISIFYIFNLFHFFCILSLDSHLLENIHQFIFFFISNIINFFVLIVSYFPKPDSTPIHISNLSHFLLFISTLLSFLFTLKFKFRLSIILFYYICFGLFVIIRSKL